MLSKGYAGWVPDEFCADHPRGFTVVPQQSVGAVAMIIISSCRMILTSSHNCRSRRVPSSRFSVRTALHSTQSRKAISS
ncbi:hypothetical protein BD311DRAFT_759116 [Dichomitus squalens]|uniref:Uncharacterized protein n=1 Tax=Dichomitus squalens TaxID=114155 RepID=A0A4Q9MPN1_9APHY|nr:hypothetical protein BD311DRAFT_759116 [Dichomitus squalens]